MAEDDRMATVGQWVEGARPRTLPNAIAPVLVGAGAAAAIGHFVWWQTVLALLVSLALVVGVNFANDYSDGIRGTDTDRVGPLRLVGSGLAAPDSVRTVALASLGLAAVVGLTLIAASGRWWLLIMGLACIAAAWFYTGGRKPYGYFGFGEFAVFVFFGPIGVLGTLYVQSGTLTWTGVAGAVAVGAFSAAVLVANNLRDIPTDVRTGKLTLAVRLGDRRSRLLYTVLVLIPLVISVVAGPRRALFGLIALPLLAVSLIRVLRGDTGLALVPVLRDTALAMLLWSAVTGAALATG